MPQHCFTHMLCGSCSVPRQRSALTDRAYRLWPRCSKALARSYRRQRRQPLSAHQDRLSPPWEVWVEGCFEFAQRCLGAQSNFEARATFAEGGNWCSTLASIARSSSKPSHSVGPKTRRRRAQARLVNMPLRPLRNQSMSEAAARPSPAPHAPPLLQLLPGRPGHRSTHHGDYLGHRDPTSQGAPRARSLKDGRKRGVAGWRESALSG